MSYVVKRKLTCATLLPPPTYFTQCIFKRTGGVVLTKKYVDGVTPPMV